MSQGSLSQTEDSGCAEVPKITCSVENLPQQSCVENRSVTLETQGETTIHNPENIHSSSSISKIAHSAQPLVNINSNGAVNSKEGPSQIRSATLTTRTGETNLTEENGQEGSSSSVTGAKEVCKFFARTGWCKFGKNCRYAHPNRRKSDHEGLGKDDESSRQTAVAAAATSSSIVPTCRFFASMGRCRYGLQCRFAHVSKKANSEGDDAVSGVDLQPKGAGGDEEVESLSLSTSQLSVTGDGRQRVKTRRCQFYDRGYCRMGNRCRYLHDETSVSVNKTPEDVSRDDDETSQGEWQEVRKHVNPMTVTSRPLAELKDGDAQQMRAVEISQLKKRFPGDKLEVSGDENNPTYRFTVSPTDPDWPFDLKNFDLMITFPMDYPLKPFQLEMPEDQVLPNVILTHMSVAIAEWLTARHATNQISNRAELMVRPFLRWFDRSLEKLFTEGARKFKKEVYAKAAGFEFISYAKPDATSEVAVSEESEAPAYRGKEFIYGERVESRNEDEEEEGEGDDEDEDDDDDDVDEEEEEEEKESKPSATKMSIYESPTDNRRGTEIRLQQLKLSESTATLTCQKIKLCIQCSRCKENINLDVTYGRALVVHCPKCQREQTVAYRPCIVHQFSPVLGFLDLNECVPVDLIVFESNFTVSCMMCSDETHVKGFQYGQARQVWCLKCHEKMSISVGSTKFQRLVASTPEGPKQVVSLKKQRRVNDPAIKEGSPLPANGACKHYKKSFRWLRFPCCGKCYPCDECHDLAELDHEMKFATRMICGFCAKEQIYSADKPCIACGSNTTKSRTTHWEGGTGCRNKSKMSRLDKQKFANLNKTTSRKAQKMEDIKKGKKK
ncbi:uncharacterized protein [Diadema antillarum]|uniref:uncharacterized protein n=1 Tax=Diadema antillarum TaxID=105358 RepID=UPI003A85E7AC